MYGWKDFFKRKMENESDTRQAAAEFSEISMTASHEHDSAKIENENDFCQAAVTLSEISMTTSHKECDSATSSENKVGFENQIHSHGSNHVLVEKKKTEGMKLKRDQMNKSCDKEVRHINESSIVDVDDVDDVLLTSKDSILLSEIQQSRFPQPTQTENLEISDNTTANITDNIIDKKMLTSPEYLLRVIQSKHGNIKSIEKNEQIHKVSSKCKVPLIAITDPNTSSKGNLLTKMKEVRNINESTISDNSVSLTTYIVQTTNDETKESNEIQESDVCQSCKKLREEMNAIKMQSHANFQIFKQKLMSTGELITEYHKKSQELEKQLKLNSNLKTKLDGCYGETGSLRIQLEKAIHANEPLRKTIRRLEYDKSVSVSRAEELEQKIRSMEQEASSLKVVINSSHSMQDSFKKEKEDSEKQHEKEKRKVLRQGKLLDKLNDKLKETRLKLRNEEKKNKNLVKEKEKFIKKFQIIEKQNLSVSKYTRTGKASRKSPSGVLSPSPSPPPVPQKNGFRKAKQKEKGNRWTDLIDAEKAKSSSSSSSSASSSSETEGDSGDELQNRWNEILKSNHESARRFRLPTYLSPPLSPMPPSPLSWPNNIVRSVVNRSSLLIAKDTNNDIDEQSNDHDVMSLFGDISQSDDDDNDFTPLDDIGFDNGKIVENATNYDKMKITQNYLAAEILVRDDNLVDRSTSQAKSTKKLLGHTDATETENDDQLRVAEVKQCISDVIAEISIDKAILKKMDGDLTHEEIGCSQLCKQTKNQQTHYSISQPSTSKQNECLIPGMQQVVNEQKHRSRTLSSSTLNPDSAFKRVTRSSSSSCLPELQQWNLNDTNSSNTNSTNEEHHIFSDILSTVIDDRSLNESSSRTDSLLTLGFNMEGDCETVVPVSDSTSLVSETPSNIYSGLDATVDNPAKNAFNSHELCEGKHNSDSTNNIVHAHRDISVIDALDHINAIPTDSSAKFISTSVSNNDNDVSNTKPLSTSVSNNGNDISNRKPLPTSVISDNDNDVSNTKPLSTSVSNNGDDVSNRKPLSTSVSNNGDDVSNTKPLSTSVSNNGNDISNTKPRSVSVSNNGNDVSNTKLRSTSVSDDGNDISITKLSLRRRRFSTSDINLAQYNNKGQSSASLPSSAHSDSNGINSRYVPNNEIAKRNENIHYEPVKMTEFKTRSLFPTATDPLDADTILITKKPLEVQVKKCRGKRKSFITKNKLFAYVTMPILVEDVLQNTNSNQSSHVTSNNECKNDSEIKSLHLQTNTSEPTSMKVDNDVECKGTVPNEKNNGLSDRSSPRTLKEECVEMKQLQLSANNVPLSDIRPKEITASAITNSNTSSNTSKSIIRRHSTFIRNTSPVPLQRIERTRSLSPSMFRPPSPPLSPIPPSPRRSVLTPIISPLPTTPQPESVSPLPPSPKITSPPLIRGTALLCAENSAVLAPKPLSHKSLCAAKELVFTRTVNSNKNVDNSSKIDSVRSNVQHNVSCISQCATDLVKPFIVQKECQHKCLSSEPVMNLISKTAHEQNEFYTKRITTLLSNSNKKGDCRIKRRCSSSTMSKPPPPKVAKTDYVSTSSTLSSFTISKPLLQKVAKMDCVTAVSTMRSSTTSKPHLRKIARTDCVTAVSTMSTSTISKPCLQKIARTDCEIATSTCCLSTISTPPLPKVAETECVIAISTCCSSTVSTPSLPKVAETDCVRAAISICSSTFSDPPVLKVTKLDCGPVTSTYSLSTFIQPPLAKVVKTDYTSAISTLNSSAISKPPLPKVAKTDYISPASNFTMSSSRQRSPHSVTNIISLTKSAEISATSGCSNGQINTGSNKRKIQHEVLDSNSGRQSVDSTSGNPAPGNGSLKQQAGLQLMKLNPCISSSDDDSLRIVTDYSSQDEIRTTRGSSKLRIIVDEKHNKVEAIPKTNVMKDSDQSKQKANISKKDTGSTYSIQTVVSQYVSGTETLNSKSADTIEKKQSSVVSLNISNVTSKQHNEEGELTSSDSDAGELIVDELRVRVHSLKVKKRAALPLKSSQDRKLMTSKKRDSKETEVGFVLKQLKKYLSKSLNFDNVVTSLCDRDNLCHANSLSKAYVTIVRTCEETLLPNILRSLESKEIVCKCEETIKRSLCEQCGDDACTCPQQQFDICLECRKRRSVSVQELDLETELRKNIFNVCHPFAARLNTPVLTVNEYELLAVFQDVVNGSNVNGAPRSLLNALHEAVVTDIHLLTCERMALCRFYTAVCRIYNRLDQLIAFIYSMAYDSLPNTSYPTFFITCYSVWPSFLSRTDIFSQNQDGSLVVYKIKLSPLSAVLQLVALGDAVSRKESTSHKILERLLNIKWSSNVSYYEEVANELFMLLCNIQLSFTTRTDDGSVVMCPFVFSVIKALQILCTRLGWEWSYNILIVEKVWKVLETWRDDDEIHTDTVAIVIRLTGHLCRIGLACGYRDLTELAQTMCAFLEKAGGDESVPESIHIAIAYTLLDIAPSKPTLCTPILRTWLDHMGSKFKIPEILREGVAELRNVHIV